VSDETLTAGGIRTADTVPLRLAVLRPGCPADAAVFDGDDDPHTFHAGVRLGGRVVGVASVYLQGRGPGAPGGAPPVPAAHDGTCWQLRGMATQDGLRGRGVGRLALRACLAHVASRGGTWAWCNARTGAVGFYAAQGWRVVSPEFDIPTVGPHVVMETPVAPAASGGGPLGRTPRP
jgi:GNAT superfamily N-acetyltransferase